jgi:Zn-dependent protease with chaperone function
MDVMLVFLAAVAVVPFASSLVSALALCAASRSLGHLAPVGQSRVLLAVALTPALVSCAFVAALVGDLTLDRLDPHQCQVYGSRGSSLLAAGLAGMWILHLGRRGCSALLALRRSQSLVRVLESVSSSAGAAATTTRIVPIDEPQAFVLGMWRPRMYLSRGLLQRTDPRDLLSVMAHERHHIARRDPLRRLVASIALGFHLPGIARAIERRLVATLESAADADAARVTGDAPRVAEALVRMARLRLTQERLAVGMLDGGLEFRVRELLGHATRPDRPSAALLVAIAAIGFAAALLAAHPLHTVFESLVRLLAAG